MSNLISSAVLIDHARRNAGIAIGELSIASQNDHPDPWRYLNAAENELILALAEVRIAKHGIKRRAPQFTQPELDRLIANECAAIGFDLTTPA